jgi:uncharacterized protein (DUF983 family)
MDLREIGLDSTVSGQGPVAGCCECGDEPSGSCATELVSYLSLCSVVFVCMFCIFMTYSTSRCHSNLWIHGMYIYVCMYVCTVIHAGRNSD